MIWIGSTHPAEIAREFYQHGGEPWRTAGDQIAAEIEQRGRPLEWQRIETAPKDGTALLGYFGSTAGEEPPDMAVTKFNAESDAWISTEVPFEEFDTPTHWMPLPDPPESK
jgi:hypothetical protein